MHSAFCLSLHYDILPTTDYCYYHEKHDEMFSSDAGAPADYVDALDS